MIKMAQLKLCFLLMTLLIFSMSVPVQAQNGCGDAPVPQLIVGQNGEVLFTDGSPLNVRDAGSLNGTLVGQIPEGASFVVVEGPVCADDIYWWHIQGGGVDGWAAEGVSGAYFVGPVATTTLAPESSTANLGFVTTWDWAAFPGSRNSPDPMTITPPPVYAGDMPTLPVNTNEVLFVEDANLNAEQLALLAQNGFVVIPAGFDQFDDAYYGYGEDWPTVPADFGSEEMSLGHPLFVTTDSMLHALHYIFDNLLTDLERSAFITQIADSTQASLNAAHIQAQMVTDTPLAVPAHNAELYLAVGLELLSPGSLSTVVSNELADEAQSIAALALAGEGQEPLPFLENYREDFSQYRPRGHYAGDFELENYFRGMNWLSRITFRANDDAETLTALLLLRALRATPDGLAGWQTVNDALNFLIGPVDDLGPPEYGLLADEVFGADLALANLMDAGRLVTFQARVAELPGPRVNGLILPAGTGTEDVEELTRGFRYLGQRFTFDGYLMQQLMYPYVGTFENRRSLPLGLDLAAVMGSETAYALAAEAGATGYENYDAQMALMRQQVGGLSDAELAENVYGGWLWTLRPLWERDPISYPPLMNTEAWLRRDLQTGLASWTELKHDTILYVKQPTGFGGGGPPLASFGYVEPNPLVFARIAIVAATTYQGLTERGLMPVDPSQVVSEQMLGLTADSMELRELAVRAASFAEIARRELAGEPLTDDQYFSIQLYDTYLNTLLRTLYQGEGEPDPVALVTDVANDGMASVLQEGVGGVDYIYVVIPSPRGGTQLARGGVFSYYEWVGDINQRMTDEEWRAQVESGQLPPRPDWVSTFYSE